MEIRRSHDCLISTMGFPILVRWYLYIESGPLLQSYVACYRRPLAADIRHVSLQQSDTSCHSDRAKSHNQFNVNGKRLISASVFSGSMAESVWWIAVKMNNDQLPFMYNSDRDSIRQWWILCFTWCKHLFQMDINVIIEARMRIKLVEFYIYYMFVNILVVCIMDY